MQGTLPPSPQQLTWFQRYLLVIIFCLFLPAYLVNLHVVPLIEDECIRATVAMEMNITQDYLTPTIGGDIYLKKPPLYNWILAGIFSLTGSQSEFIIRLPVTIAVILFSLIIYLFVRSETNNKLAIVTALGFATCGRILFYESQHGLIDVTFSMFVFLNFILVYKAGKRKRYLWLFLGSYALTAFGFLFKGLPSLVFQAFTLIAWFAYDKDLKRLFSWKHVLGIALFLVPVLAYYLAYFLHNSEVTLQQMFGIMLGESTRRTGIRFGALAVIAHLFTFPFEVLYHYSPWTLFVILLFRKANLQKVVKNDLLRYGLWVVGLNIIPYWSSPEVFARYYIMMMPFIFLVFFYLYLEEDEGNRIIRTILEWALIVMAVLVSCVPLAYILMDRFSFVPMQGLKVTLLLAGSFGLTALLYLRKDRIEKLFVVILLLLVARIGVDWFMLPLKARESDRLVYKNEAIRAAQITGDRKIVRYWPPEIKATGYYGHRTASYLTIFYMTREKHQVIGYSEEIPNNEDFYLVRYMDLARLDKPYIRFYPVHYDRDYPPINLVRFLPETDAVPFE